MELYHLKIYIDDLLHRAVVSKGARKPKVFLMKKMKKMSKNSFLKEFVPQSALLCYRLQ